MQTRCHHSLEPTHKKPDHNIHDRSADPICYQHAILCTFAQHCLNLVVGWQGPSELSSGPESW